MSKQKFSSIIAIDPMALLLSESLFLIYLEKKHPHIPLTKTMTELAKQMTVAEKKRVLSRVRATLEIAKCVQEAVA